MTTKLALDTLLNQLNWRCAIKKFDPQKKLSPEQWQTLEETLILTPSSYGLQPWKFIVVTEAALKEKLRPVSWNQSQITDCSHLVVLLAKTHVSEAYVDKFIAETARIRGLDKSKLETYKKNILADIVTGPRSLVAREWAARQVYIALGNLMTSAAVLGIDTCPLEGIEPQQYDIILDLKGSGFETCVACAVGFRSPDDAYSKLKKVRFAASEVIVKK